MSYTADILAKLRRNETQNNNINTSEYFVLLKLFEHDKQSHFGDDLYFGYDTLSFQDKLEKLKQDTVDDFASENQLNKNQKNKLNDIFSHANEDETPLGDAKTSVNVAIVTSLFQ